MIHWRFCLEASFLLKLVAKYVLDHPGRLQEDLSKDLRNQEGHEMDQSLPLEGLWKDLRNPEGHEMARSLPLEDLWKDLWKDLTNLEGFLTRGFL